jgi:hypothetical protein
MENDCDDTLKGSSPIPDLTDIARLLKSLTVQLTSQNNKLSDDFHHVMHTHDVFKQDTKMPRWIFLSNLGHRNELAIPQTHDACRVKTPCNGCTSHN